MPRAVKGSAPHPRATLLEDRPDLAERVIRAAGAITVVLDAAGRILEPSPALARLKGTSVEALRGRDGPEALAAERDRAAMRDVLDTATASPSLHEWSGTLAGPNDVTRDIEWSVMLVGEAGSPGETLWIGRDMTDRVRAERDASMQLAITRTLSEATSLEEAAGELLRAIGHHTRYDVVELWMREPDTKWLDRIGLWCAPDVDRGAVDHVLYREGDGPKAPTSLALRERVAGPDGSPGFATALSVPIRVAGPPRGYVTLLSRWQRAPDESLAVLFDTLGHQIGRFLERLDAETRVRDLAAIVRSSRDAIVGSTLVGIVESWNPAAASVFGVGAAEAIGRPIWPLFDDAEHEKLREAIDAIRRRRLVEPIDCLGRRADGEPIETSISLSPVLGQDDHEIVGVSIIARDVTEQARARRELEEARRLAGERGRLAEIGAITAEIVHDVQNPVTGISLQAQLITRRASRHPERPIGDAVEPARKILGETERIETLVGDFLAFSQEQRLRLAELDVRDFLAEVAEFWAPIAAAEQATVVFQPAEATGTAGTIRADREKLRRVVDNLVRNSIEAGARHIELRAEADDADQVQLAVADDGPGLPNDIDPFRLFESSKPNGTGLGLAIALQIVHAHAGRIALEPREGGGTQAVIELPRAGAGLP